MRFFSIGGIINYISHHKIPIEPKTRWIGLRDVMTGWALIAAASVFFKVPATIIPMEINFAIQFGTGVLIILLGSLIYGLFTGKWFDYILIREGEVFIGKSTLSLQQRLLLIYFRGFLAIAGYMIFEVAKDRVGIVENSVIQVTLAFFLLKQQFNLREWIGITLAILGISSVLYFDADMSIHLMTIWGYLLGAISAICLALLIILTSVVVQHNHPICICFHQCLCGLVLALVMITFSGGISLSDLSMANLYDAFLGGVLYTCALFCFFRSYLFIEPFVIAISGFSLVVFTSIFESIVHQEVVNLQGMISSLLIALGCGILIYYQYKKETKAPEREKLLDLSRFLFLARNKFQHLKTKYGLGEINKYEYISEMHENQKILFELSSLIKQRPIEQISIENGSVIFKFEPHSIELEIDRAIQAAPFEILHFGNYDEEKNVLAFQLIQDGDVILDVGAHLGWYSLTMAKKFPKSTIHAFEPLKPNFDILERNIKRNFISNVIPYSFGLSDRNIPSDFYYFELASPMGSRINVLSLDRCQTIPGKLQKLDDIVSLENIERIDYIKCDTEGNDLHVLYGAQESLVKFHPIIEINLFWNDKFGYFPTDIFDFLNDYGYDCFSIKKRRLKRALSVDSTNREKRPHFFLHRKKHQSLIEKLTGSNI